MTYTSPAFQLHDAMMAGLGPVGRVRGTIVALILTVITLGLYNCYWIFVVHREMKKHSGSGLGGGWALVIMVVTQGWATPFVTSNEVGNLHRRAWEDPPVSAATGFWVLPGFVLVIGPIVWFVRTNNALNAYWRLCETRLHSQSQSQQPPPPIAQPAR